MFQTIPITKARQNLGSLVKDVLANKSKYILQKDGLDTVALIDIAELEDLLDSVKAYTVMETQKDQSMPLEDMLSKYGV